MTELVNSMDERLQGAVANSEYTHEEQLEVDKIRKELEAFYTVHDKKRLAEGLDEIVDWTLRNGLEAVNAKLSQKYGKDLASISTDMEEGGEEWKKLEEDSELVQKLKEFFKVHAPTKQRNYQEIVNFVNRKGLPALNKKLQEKYGANLNTFLEEEDDDESLPSILGGMPKILPGNSKRSKRLSLSSRSGINPLDGKEDNHERIQMYDRLSAFYNKYGKERLKNGIGNIVDWAIEHGEAALNEKLQKRYNTDLTEFEKAAGIEFEKLTGVNSIEEDEEIKKEEEELEKLPQPKDEGKDEEKRYSKDARLSLKSGVNPLNGEQDSEARLELQNRLTAFYGYFRKDKLNKGIGDIVDWAIDNGEEALNEQLRSKYGYDLDSFQKKLEEKKGEETTKREEEEEELKDEVGLELSVMRERLIRFFKKYDPERAEKSLDLLIKYIEIKGFKALNEKLFAKYGADINTFEEAQEEETDAEKAAREKQLERRSMKFTLPPWVATALELYYVKFNPSYIDSGGVESVFQWGMRNGLKALNQSLESEYGESLETFVKETDTLREELVAFYKMADEEKDTQGIEQVVHWGIKNGREALNKQLRKKYRFDLDIAKEEYDENEPENEQIF